MHMVQWDNSPIGNVSREKTAVLSQELSVFFTLVKTLDFFS